MKSSVSVIRSASLLVALGLRAVLDEAQHPLVHVVEVGVAALAKARSRLSVAADWR
jgi:hypothetical protein